MPRMEWPDRCDHEYEPHRSFLPGVNRERCRICGGFRYLPPITPDPLTAEMRNRILQSAAANLDALFMGSLAPAEPEPALPAQIEEFLKTL